jgi:hypothetical protein
LGVDGEEYLFLDLDGSQISCNNEELGLLFLDYSEEELLRWLPYQYPP